MKTELENLIMTEKWRPDSFDELILACKEDFLGFLSNKRTIPSFIFYSSKPGTGKTSLAKLVIKELGCDSLILNSSEERGIDTIRDKIKLFSQSLSSNDAKRCIFLDEADGLTKIALDSLRNLMEEYSDNVFFIFTANDLNKIIEPIRSRCVSICFENPPKHDILERLMYICRCEQIEHDPEDISKLVDLYYPDMRSMILTLQGVKAGNKTLLVEFNAYEEVFEAMMLQNAKELYSRVYSSNFNCLGFNKWLFHKIMTEFDKWGYQKVAKVTRYLADTEKHWNLGVSLEVVFLANIMQISDTLNS